MGSTHMVSSGNSFASLAGLQILEEGGNAIDAGVAAGIAINVTQPRETSFAGVAPIIIYLADKREVVTISGVGRWPKAVSLESFKKTYDGIPVGVSRCVVPAACDAWLTSLELYGTMTFEQVVIPALRLAGQGFPLSRGICHAINSGQAWMERWPYYREVFAANGLPVKPGQPLVQKDLAQVFRQMIEVEQSNAGKGRQGAIRAARDFFYKGSVAEKMVSYCQQEGGLLTLDDFAQFSVKVEKPETGIYRDYTLYTCGPWCQGPTLISVLNLLEGYDLRALGHNFADYIHLLVEAIKLTFSDRHHYYGDPDLVEVPIAGLLSKEYAVERRRVLDMAKAWPEMPPPGNPWPYQGIGGQKRDAMVPGSAPGPLEPDTSYACVVDRWGNAISATPSDGFGTTPMVPGLGMIISPRGRQTWLEEDHPSRLEPWKRPRLTPCPAIACRNGKLFMPFGTPGGDMQVQGMVQMFLNMVEFGLDPQQAVEEPRVASLSFPNSGWPHSYYPGLISLESRIPQEVGVELNRRGHQVEWTSAWGHGDTGLCGIMVDQELGTLVGAADPRSESYAIGR